ncbi:hypothetical protein NKG94_20815 [Micromonospora sp. M12]
MGRRQLRALPGEPGDAYEDDFVLLADAFVTGWHAAATLAGVEAGDTVAVFGAGTIGLLGAYSALLRGARWCTASTVSTHGWTRPARSEPYRSTSAVATRSSRSARTGPGPVCLSARRSWAGSTRSSTRSVSRPATGSTLARSVPTRSSPTRPGWSMPPARSRSPASTRRWTRTRPRRGRSREPGRAVGTLFSKGVAVRFGRTHDRRYTVLLRDLVVAGAHGPA